jgi:hypothetical protein
MPRVHLPPCDASLYRGTGSPCGYVILSLDTHPPSPPRLVAVPGVDATEIFGRTRENSLAARKRHKSLERIHRGDGADREIVVDEDMRQALLLILVGIEADGLLLTALVELRGTTDSARQTPQPFGSWVTLCDESVIDRRPPGYGFGGRPPRPVRSLVVVRVRPAGTAGVRWWVRLPGYACASAHVRHRGVAVLVVVGERSVQA